jgi:small subunit ribosomal protein S3|tara:strand:- start:2136 stop:2768 length:633 start_codon:yes stop_codon:yes gene_type:complete
MGQKANINSLHISHDKDWNCVWYANNVEYSKILSEDLIIFNYFKSSIVFNKNSEILKIRICRISKSIIINLQLTNNLESNSLDLLRKVAANLKKIFSNFDRIFIISKVLNSNELKVEPVYLSKKIARLIENRIRFKSFLVKNLINQTFEICEGIKVLCKGRLNGADIAGNDFLILGSIPFQTLKARIMYGFSVANTAKGLQSIKIWVYNK